MIAPRKAPLGADLHLHTLYSDGRDTPAELCKQARGRLSVISICDHDTLLAYDHLPPEMPDDVTLLPGIEISAYRGDTGIHLLGYFPHGITPRLRERVKELEEDRRQRVHAGVQRLRDEGIGLRWRHLEELVGPGVPCRSHVARVLIQMGYARNPQVIFERFLLGGRFARPALEVKEAIALVHAEAGISVWAHPPIADVENLITGLTDDGLSGLEVYTPRRKRRERRLLEVIANEHSLIATGGSDHHAGNLFGNFFVAEEKVPEALLSSGVIHLEH